MTTKTQHAPERPPQEPKELEQVKSRMKATWEDGDYTAFSRYMEPGAIEILEAWNIPSGTRMLDIGCGAGQTVIPAARRGIHATGIDIAENLIHDARARTRKAGLIARFDVGDAEQLPYADRAFDCVVSLIGAMFAPRPSAVATQMARVLRPGGQLYMANWTPDSFPAQMFKCLGARVPPPPGVPSPVLWGDEATVQARLAAHFTDIRLTRKTYPRWHYSFTPGELVDFFRTHFGPVKRAFEAAKPEDEQALHDDLAEIYTANSEFRDGILTMTGGEYLEVIATRR